jgi:hypothetical protein
MYIEKQYKIQNTAAKRFDGRPIKTFHQAQNFCLRRLTKPSDSVARFWFI